MSRSESGEYEKNDQRKVFFPAKVKSNIFEDGRLFRTCAYCRVSTDSDEQLSSYQLQQEHYSSLVGKHKNWDLRKIYADEGISGTSLKNRTQFNEMIKACEAGQFDLIVTKSVSRFARNLVDCISLIRRLKNLSSPVGVFFETDNLFTLSEDSELKLSLLATFAQEESIKKSESMVWSLRERFKNKRLLMPELLGYERERDSSGKKYVRGAKLQIVESEAAIIRFIYDAFLAGYSTQSIAEILTSIGCATKTGNTVWNEGSIGYILRNERYCGNVLTWKTFTSDIFEHRKKKNRQDRDQYLYENQHEAIISVEKYEAVQTLIENKKHHVRGGYPAMYVIDSGLFHGYVPVNHHWINDDPNVYFEASNSVQVQSHARRIRRSKFSMFNLEGYQVVRGQFLTARAECPSLTVSNKKLSFNVECTRKFSDVQYVQLLIHPSKRRIAIRPCEAHDIHSIKWRTHTGKAVSGKTLLCQYFCHALFRIMDWDPEFQYRVRGTWAARGREEIIVFDITKAFPFTYLSHLSDPHRRRVDLCPEEWAESFGEEFYDFSMQNGFYYLNPQAEWNAQAKSRLVPNSMRISILSQDELQSNIENLKVRVGTMNE